VAQHASLEAVIRLGLDRDLSTAGWPRVNFLLGARAFFQSAFDGGAALSESKDFAVEDEQGALRGSMESAVP